MATDGEGGSQERVDTLGKSKFSTMPHICFWPEKMDQKSPPQFFGVKKIPPRSQLGLLLHQITMVRIQHKTWPSGSVIVNPPTTKLLSAFFLPNSRCLCCHCLESASEQGGGVGPMVREVRTAPTFSAPRRRRMSGGRHSVLMCVNAHRCASNATRSPNAHIMFAWMASAWSCFDVWTSS